jgi:hypothetical protein
MCARIYGTVGNLLLFINFRNYGYEEKNLTSDKGTNYETRSNHLVNKYVNGISGKKKDEITVWDSDFNQKTVTVKNFLEDIDLF